MHPRTLFTVAGVVGVLGAVSASVVLAGRDMPQPGEAGKVTVVKDTENVVASELMGTWYPNGAVSALLGVGDEAPFGSLTFKEDADSAAQIKKAIEEKILGSDKAKSAPEHELKAWQNAMASAYLSGKMILTIEGNEVPFSFLLVTWRGNPHVFFFDGKKNFESFNVTVARDIEGDKDILFLGGDFNNETFRAFTREKPAEREKKSE